MEVKDLIVFLQDNCTGNEPVTISDIEGDDPINVTSVTVSTTLHTDGTIKNVLIIC